MGLDGGPAIARCDIGILWRRRREIGEATDVVLKEHESETNIGR